MAHRRLNRPLQKFRNMSCSKSTKSTTYARQNSKHRYQGLIVYIALLLLCTLCIEMKCTVRLYLRAYSMGHSFSLCSHRHLTKPVQVATAPQLIAVRTQCAHAEAD